MRIAINIRLWLPGRLDGIGWFAVETVMRITTQHPEHEFFLLCDRKVDLQWELPKNTHQVILHPPARHPVLWYLFFEWGVAPALKGLRIDLFVSTDGWMSLRTKVPTLTVIHDINYEHAEDYLRPSHQRYMKRYFPQFAQQAVRVATVSQFSRKDIAETYHIPLSKIDVVYDGSHSCYHPLSEDEKAAVREQYTQGCPYYIFIGTITKRKNLTNTLLAFDRFKESDEKSTKMLVVGSRVWWEGELKEAYDNMKYRQDVIFVGWAPATELAKMLAAAIALTYVSFFEGFGIPILEAFHAETAVISGNNTSIPEVAGDAALLADPYNVGEIASCMTRLAIDENLRNTLIAKGATRKDLFSWQRTADLLWDSMMKTFCNGSENKSQNSCKQKVTTKSALLLLLATLPLHISAQEPLIPTLVPPPSVQRSHSEVLEAKLPTNLVYNPSFEEYLDCPTKVDAHGVLTTVQAWFQPTAGSADYYNTCSTKECGVPNNKLGVQYPHSGNGFCGIYCSKTNYREYLQTQLKEPLEAGETYQLTFYVSLSEYSAHSVATIGGLLSETCPMDTGNHVLMQKETRKVTATISQTIATYYKPQVQNDYFHVLGNTASWTEIDGTFVAQGGERFLTIGNFLPASQSNVTDISTLTCLLPGAYYYIDDVSLICLTCRADNEDDAAYSSDTKVLDAYNIEEQTYKYNTAADLPEEALKEGATFILKNIYFDFDKSTLLQQSYVELRGLLQVLESHPKMCIEVRGHTDGKGSADYNQHLSESRAHAVVDFLIANGIDEHRLEYKGYGKTRPISNNHTAEGRATNRRVEFKILCVGD